MGIGKLQRSMLQKKMQKTTSLAFVSKWVTLACMRFSFFFFIFLSHDDHDDDEDEAQGQHSCRENTRWAHLPSSTDRLVQPLNRAVGVPAGPAGTDKRSEEELLACERCSSVSPEAILNRLTTNVSVYSILGTILGAGFSDWAANGSSESQTLFKVLACWHLQSFLLCLVKLLSSIVCLF